MTTTTPPAGSDQVGGDVVTVGHEIGHIAADGTIVGRAEPYAKVFTSSRQVKRTVGVMAWAILEDIALDARIDHTGRLVAATNVRRIAANLGVSKNTVARHLTRLRDAGFVLHEEGNHDHDGRYTVSRYVLDPSACVERFTHTPPRSETSDTDHHHAADAVAEPAERAQPGADDDHADDDRVTHNHVDSHDSTNPAESATDDGSGPCTDSGDTVDGTVSQSVGHRELGHNRQEVVVLEEQHRAREGPPDDPAAAGRLIDAGITPTKAADLASRHPTRRIAHVLDAVSVQNVDNPPGWITTALDQNWDIHDLATRAQDQRRHRRRQALRRAARQGADDAAARHARTQHRRNQGWADLAADILDDDQLAGLLDHLRDPRFPRSTRSVRLTTAQVTGWFAAACHSEPDVEPSRAIATALTNPAHIDPPDDLPPPPPTHAPRVPLDRRIAELLHALHGQADPEHPTSRSVTPRGESDAA